MRLTTSAASRAPASARQNALDRDMRAISESASMCGPDLSGGATIRKNNFDGAPSIESNGMPSGAIPMAIAKSETAGVFPCGTAIPSVRPVLPRVSRENRFLNFRSVGNLSGAEQDADKFPDHAVLVLGGQGYPDHGFVY